MADTYVVERSQTIDAAPEAVFAKVVDLTEWDSWSPWAGNDPNMTTTHTGTAGEVGSSYSWQGNRQVGAGKMTVTATEPPNRVALDLAFLKPFKSESEVEWLIERTDSGSEITWRMTGAMTFMMKIFGIFKSMDKMVGPDFENGLANLKGELES